MKFEIPKCPKCGSCPKGTHEMIPGLAQLREPDDDGEYDYEGETLVCYEGQETEFDSDNRATLECANRDCLHEWKSGIDGSERDDPSVPLTPYESYYVYELREKYGEPDDVLDQSHALDGSILLPTFKSAIEAAYGLWSAHYADAEAERPDLIQVCEDQWSLEYGDEWEVVIRCHVLMAPAARVMNRIDTSIALMQASTPLARLISKCMELRNASDSEHPDFLDSGADVIEMLWDRAFSEVLEDARVQNHIDWLERHLLETPVIVFCEGGCVTDVIGVASYELVDWDNAKAGDPITLSENALGMLSAHVQEEIAEHNASLDEPVLTRKGQQFEAKGKSQP